MDLAKITEIAEQVIREVGKRIREEMELETSMVVIEKKHAEWVTEIDLWAEKRITETIKSHFPSHLVIGEESSVEVANSLGKSILALVDTGICWIVDPIDGTTNFVHGLPLVAVSIGITENGERRAAFCYDPTRDELFSAVRGQGATLNGQKIQVSKRTLLNESLIATGLPDERHSNWPHYRPVYEGVFRAARDLRKFGSAVVSQCWVACGRCDGYVEYSLKPWDVAAGSLIVEEAGGIISGLDNNFVPQKFSLTSSVFIFSCSGIARQLTEACTRIN